MPDREGTSIRSKQQLSYLREESGFYSIHLQGSGARFLSLHTVDIVGKIILCCGKLSCIL